MVCFQEGIIRKQNDTAFILKNNSREVKAGICLEERKRTSGSSDVSGLFFFEAAGKKGAR